MPPELKKLRQEIDYCYDEFRSIITAKKFSQYYGDLYRGPEVSLVKLPHGFEKDNPASEYLKLKSWFVLHSINDEEWFSEKIIDKITDVFKATLPFLNFINRALED